VLHVEDNGTGIPADVLKQMWQPFFTTKEADAATFARSRACRAIRASCRFAARFTF